MKALLTSLLLVGVTFADEPPTKGVVERLPLSGDNRPEIDKAWSGTPEAQRPGMTFLLANMPENDLRTLKADFLLKNHELAYKARKDFAWGQAVPDDLFFNNVLPYANLDEARDAWRQELFDIAATMVKD